MKIISIYFALLALLDSFTFAAPVDPITAAILIGVVGAASTGGLSCMFEFGKSGCKGDLRNKEEQKRQKDIQIGNLQNLDNIKKGDTEFKVNTTSKINSQYLENSNTNNQINMAQANANSELATTFNDGQKQELNQNLELNSALRSKLIDGSANRVKKLTDLSASLDAPVSYTKEQYDQMFPS